MKRILIVEDNTLLNKTLAYNLASDGYGITSALNAKTAADKLSSAEYDLVLLDINLPDGNGYDLEHTLTTTISRICSKIEADGGTYIKTIYGMGYQWMEGERK